MKNKRVGSKQTENDKPVIQNAVLLNGSKYKQVIAKDIEFSPLNYRKLANFQNSKVLLHQGGFRAAFGFKGWKAAPPYG